MAPTHASPTIRLTTQIGNDERMAVICSARINAVGIALSLREVGWKGRIICLAGEGDGGEVSYYFPDVCETWTVKYDEPGDLVTALNQRIPKAIPKILFFTDERFMLQFADGPEAAGLENATMHLGSAKHLQTMIDRRLLYAFVREHDLAPVPKDVPSDADPFEVFPEGFRLRVWQSFRGSKKLVRGGNVTSREELEKQRSEIEKAGLADDEWCFQELLSTKVEDCVSVSGWHDAESRHYCITRWALRINDNGMIIERTKDPDELEKTTRRVLDALDYHGVFEMEFLRNPRTDRFNLIEINPRFWMQHRLAAAALDNAMVRKYLGMPVATDSEGDLKDKRHWIHTEYVLGNFGSVPKGQLMHYLSGVVWAVPPGRLLRDKLSRRFKKKHA